MQIFYLGSAATYFVINNVFKTSYLNNNNKKPILNNKQYLKNLALNAKTEKLFQQYTHEPALLMRK